MAIPDLQKDSGTRCLFSKQGDGAFAYVDHFKGSKINIWLLHIGPDVLDQYPSLKYKDRRSYGVRPDMGYKIVDVDSANLDDALDVVLLASKKTALR